MWWNSYEHFVSGCHGNYSWCWQKCNRTRNERWTDIFRGSEKLCGKDTVEKGIIVIYSRFLYMIKTNRLIELGSCLRSQKMRYRCCWLAPKSQTTIWMKNWVATSTFPLHFQWHRPIGIWSNTWKNRLIRQTIASPLIGWTALLLQWIIWNRWGMALYDTICD